MCKLAEERKNGIVSCQIYATQNDTKLEWKYYGSTDLTSGPMLTCDTSRGNTCNDNTHYKGSIEWVFCFVFFDDVYFLFLKNQTK